MSEFEMKLKAAQKAVGLGMRPDSRDQGIRGQGTGPPGVGCTRDSDP